jgi:transcriptional regulator with XRE-family HTH domain
MNASSSSISEEPEGFRYLLQPYIRLELAKRMKTSRARVDAWANGAAFPAVTELSALAAVLRISVDALVESIMIDMQKHIDKRKTDSLILVPTPGRKTRYEMLDLKPTEAANP